MTGTGLVADRKLVPVVRAQRRMRVSVRILQARQLTAGDTGLLGRNSDPYAVAFVGESYLRTAVRMRTLEPHWDEEATLDVPLGGSALARHALHVVVYDWDLDRSDDFLGEALVPMDQLEALRPGEKLCRWFALTDAKGGSNGVSGAVRLELSAIVDEAEAAGEARTRDGVRSRRESARRTSEEEGEGEDEDDAFAREERRADRR
ncbi:C2 domain-containing protein [Pavlovales sp. CCMP2436]|nr:C2 domain-containing protein [Pavlovales sp. CCMP2436]